MTINDRNWKQMAFLACLFDSFSLFLRTDEDRNTLFCFRNVHLATHLLIHEHGKFDLFSGAGAINIGI